MKEQDELVSQLANYKWSSFIDRGAEIYHHGRVYVGDRPTLNTLSLDGDPELRQIQAREVISRLYPADRVYSAPLIIQELRENVPLEDTRVGQLLGLTSEQQSPTGHGHTHMLLGGPTGSSTSRPISDFNWFSAIVDAIKFPFEQVTAFLKELLDFADRLRAAIARLMVGFQITVSLPYLNGRGLEVVFTLGSIKFIVGYGPFGPYMARYQPQASRFHPDTAWDDGVEDESDMEYPEWGNPETLVQGRVWDMEEGDSSPEYQAIRVIFDGIVSAPDDAEPVNPSNQPTSETNQEEAPRENDSEDDLWWWQKCVMM